jgi:hypothetical protein
LPSFAAGGLSRKILAASAVLACTQMVPPPGAEEETTLSASGEWEFRPERDIATLDVGCGEGVEGWAWSETKMITKSTNHYNSLFSTCSCTSVADLRIATGLAMGAGGGGGYIDVEK